MSRLQGFILDTMKKRNLTIRQISLFAMIMFVVVPLTTFFVISVSYIANQKEKSLIDNSEFEHKRIEVLIENEIDKLTGNLYTIANSVKFRRLITDFYASDDYYNRHEVYKSIVQTDDDYPNYKLQVFVDDSNDVASTYYHENTLMNRAVLKDREWYSYMKKNDTISKLFLREIDGKTFISFAYNITDDNNYAENIATLTLTSTHTDLTSYISVASDDESISIILDSDNELLYSNSKNNLETILKEFNNIGNTSESASGICDGDRFLLISSPIAGSDWKYVQAIPKSAYSVELSSLVATWVLVGLVLLLLSVILAWYIGTVINKPIDKLSRQINDGFMDDIDSENYADDLKVIADAYNNSMHRIKRLIKQNNDAWQAEKEVELELLNLQIHPHFLYNALNTLRWEAEKNSYTQIVDGIEVLSSYLRLTIEPNDNLTTIADEVNHVRYYTDMQNLRYENCVELIVDIPNELKQKRIIRMCLQPLVENSINHGILMTESEKGSIVISAKEFDRFIELEVKDDGIGIDEDRLKMLNQELIDGVRDKYCGVGLYCVNMKLRLFYGTDCYIRLRSNINEGTTAVIRFPTDIDMI